MYIKYHKNAEIIHFVLSYLRYYFSGAFIWRLMIAYEKEVEKKETLSYFLSDYTRIE